MGACHCTGACRRPPYTCGGVAREFYGRQWFQSDEPIIKVWPGPLVGTVPTIVAKPRIRVKAGSRRVTARAYGDFRAL